MSARNAFPRSLALALEILRITCVRILKGLYATRKESIMILEVFRSDICKNELININN